jgi:hypothetical protein
VCHHFPLNAKFKQEHQQCGKSCIECHILGSGNVTFGPRRARVSNRGEARRIAYMNLAGQARVEHRNAEISFF